MGGAGVYRHRLHAEFLRKLLLQISVSLPGLYKRREYALRYSQRLDELEVPPPGFLVDELGRGGFRELAAAFPGKKICEQIRHHQHFLRAEYRVLLVLHEVVKLEQRVDVHGLYSALLEQLFLRDTGTDLLNHALGAVVAVVHRLFQQIPVLTDKPEIHAPGINADGVESSVEHAEADRDLHLLPQLVDIPAEVPVFSHGDVREAVNLLKLKSAVPDAAEHCPRAGGSEIEY